MKTITLGLFLFVAFSASLSAQRYECKITDAVSALPGSDMLDKTDSLIERKFKVNRSTGEIIGDATIFGTSVFDNRTQKKEILRDTKDIIDVFVLLSTSSKGDTTILRIKEFKGKLFFTYHHEYLGLFLIGECTEI
ncbi:hypothetical protein [Coraliomargarita akajimensis]|uniref:Uncharacterized protein n=1 Tax=Coraliomargarita akajimensis (strain DSM 45221 / IAM 15411 / JCM 23193 / KCTC 12865 / 04OKA010-24) TaxID=583355 RepID=D5EMB6_CORAD|nr:hypothetical protein [Coraliomargarita akajimensis]ADE53322.1 hypothetical protein Caka_0296 [Coraliomargarita akajimensis DSM 45221]